VEITRKGEAMKAEKMKQIYKAADIELILLGQSDIITTSYPDADGPFGEDTSDRWSDP